MCQHRLEPQGGHWTRELKPEREHWPAARIDATIIFRNFPSFVGWTRISKPRPARKKLLRLGARTRRFVKEYSPQSQHLVIRCPRSTELGCSKNARSSGVIRCTLKVASEDLQPESAPPRHTHVYDRTGNQEDRSDEQITFHVVTCARPSSVLPHSVHRSDSPTGYPHAGQSPRRFRITRRNNTNGS